MGKGTLILDNWDIEQRIKRIAYQILEDNFEEKEIHIIGIKDQGYVFAGYLADILKKIGKGKKVFLHELSLDKSQPASQDISFSFEAESLKEKVVIFTDDVANTGRTIYYAMHSLNDVLPRKVQVAVLVDRKHKLFPVCSDFVGLSLTTTIHEHISAELKSQKKAVYLN